MNSTPNNQALATLRINTFFPSLGGCLKYNNYALCNYSSLMVVCGHIIQLCVFPALIFRMSNLTKRFFISIIKNLFKIFLNQILAYQAIRIENRLTKKGSLTYEELVTITPEDFDFFCVEDFINIIGSEKVTLHSSLST